MYIFTSFEFCFDCSFVHSIATVSLRCCVLPHLPLPHSNVFDGTANHRSADLERPSPPLTGTCHSVLRRSRPAPTVATGTPHCCSNRSSLVAPRTARSGVSPHTCPWCRSTRPPQTHGRHPRYPRYPRSRRLSCSGTHLCAGPLACTGSCLLGKFLWKTSPKNIAECRLLSIPAECFYARTFSLRTGRWSSPCATHTLRPRLGTVCSSRWG